jgi:hypothetical protein
LMIVEWWLVIFEVEDESEGKAALESWIDGFTLQCQNPKHTLVHFAQRVLFDKPLQSFQTEGKLSYRKRSLTP